ncbi:M48 family metallopeptidase [Streptomyces sp. NPDC001315]|uniref:M48 family metallopeptidase n=1 Tax=Streptomyces sp. NPDC001315 TaxID=3364562 RepID=UPI0036D00CEA
MRSVAGETVQPCPGCGAEIRVDSRFTTWCAACDWNVDPARPEEQPGRLAGAQRALARRYGEKLLAEVAAGGTLRARRDASSVLAYTVALVVHGMTLALAAGGIWFLVKGWGGAGMVPGVFLLALAWSLRPRTPRLPEDVPLLRRADAPALFALVDEVAREAGTRGVDVIAVDAEFNASVMTYGVRGRRLLTLGVPLWETLGPRQRIALLGHELGHYSNGDTRHGVVVGTAYHSLTTWHFYFSPIPNPTTAMQMLMNLACLVPCWLLQGVLMLLDRLTLRATQRAEYLADRMAARAGSTVAAVELMDWFLVADSAATTLRREVNSAGVGGPRAARKAGDPAEGLWERLTAHMASIPDHERERQRRAGALRGHSVDTTHPPTHLRRSCLLAVPPVPAAVGIDDDRQRRITAELTDARGRVARRILRDGFEG